jgi:hypothetical protein
MSLAPIGEGVLVSALMRLSMNSLLAVVLETVRNIFLMLQIFIGLVFPHGHISMLHCLFTEDIGNFLCQLAI